MIARELHLPSQGVAFEWTRHDAGVVDEDVERLVSSQPALRERADAVGRGQIELADVDVTFLDGLPC